MGERSRAWRPRLLARCLLALCALACGKREPAPAVRESAPLPSLPAPPASVASTASTSSAARSAACRVMSLRGKVVTATGEVIEKGRLLEGDRWLVLEPGASLALKHTTSGRELAFDGPARVLPCFGGEEEMIVGLGTVRTQAGVGVRPGATVVLGTPYGSVRYADAQARIVVGDAGLEVPEASGDLTLVPILPPAKPVPLTGAGVQLPSAPTVDEALAACSQAAQSAHDQARALLAATAGARGELEASHVRARGAARLTCAAATASALARGDAMEIGARLQRLSELRAQWMEVPGR
jgi:hypothetical protein